MSLHAVEEIDDALERTKDILMPFDIGTWTRLAIIVLFIGGSGFTGMFTNIPTGSPGQNYDSPSGEMTGMATAAPELGDAALAAIAVGALSLLTIFMYLSSVFQFVMFSSLRNKEISIRDNFKKYYVDGLKYFLFLVGYSISIIAVVAGIVGLFTVNPILGALSILIGIPIFILLAIFSGVVHDFALQKIIEEEIGFIQAVKQSTSQVTQDWGEFGGYVLFRLLVSWAVGIISIMTTFAILMILGIPLLIIAAISFIFPPLGILVALVAALIMMVAMAYVAVPFQVYLYNYFVELYDAFME